MQIIALPFLFFNLKGVPIIMKILLKNYLLQNTSKMMAAIPPSQRIPMPPQIPEIFRSRKPLPGTANF